MLIVADDVEDPVADGTRIDLDVIMSRRQFSHQAFGDVAIGRNENFASLGVYDVEKDWFAQGQDISKRIDQLFD